MKTIFRILAILSGIGAVIQLYYFILSSLAPDLLITVVLLFSGLINLVSSYAWKLIGSMWEKRQELERRISLK